MYGVTTRDVPARRLLRLLRHAHAQEMLVMGREFFIHRMRDADLPRVPGIAGAPFMIFHGEVCAREAAALRGLAGRLPVPAVVDVSAGRLRMGLMDGVQGQKLIEAGLAGQVLRACGRMLRRIHAIDPAEVVMDAPDQARRLWLRAGPE